MMTDPLFGSLTLKAATAGFPAVIRKIQSERWERAKAIFLKRMKHGSIVAGLEDRAAYNTWLYFRAAADGAAARNLELIAQAVRSDIDEPTLIAEDMKRILDALASLSREEAVLLGLVVRLQAQVRDGKVGDETLWAAVLLQLQGNPLFPSGADVGAHGYALTRTGWLMPVSGFGALGIAPTPRLDVISRMVDFNDPDVTAA